MCNLRRGPARAHSCPESGPARAPGHCPVSLSHCNNMNKHPNPTIRVKCVISFISLFQNLNRSSARAHEAHLGFREGVNCSQHAYYYLPNVLYCQVSRFREFYLNLHIHRLTFLSLLFYSSLFYEKTSCRAGTCPQTTARATSRRTWPAAAGTAPGPPRAPAISAAAAAGAWAGRTTWRRRRRRRRKRRRRRRRRKVRRRREEEQYG